MRPPCRLALSPRQRRLSSKSMVASLSMDIDSWLLRAPWLRATNLLRSAMSLGENPTATEILVVGRSAMTSPVIATPVAKIAGRGFGA
jgi:hypothetical protein